MHAHTDPRTAPRGAAVTIVVHPLKENPRPIGFAPWPKPKRKRAARKEADGGA